MRLLMRLVGSSLVLLLSSAYSNEALFVNGKRITFSDDDSGMSLPSFLLAIFPIYDSLPDNAIDQVSQAMDDFVLAELNALYYPTHKVKDINTTISKLAYDEYDDLRRLGIEEPTHQERIEWEMARGAVDTPIDEKKLLRGRRRLDILPGIVMEMQINVTFDQQPTPSEIDTAEDLKKIMQDLSDYVNDLRDVKNQDLAGVRFAFRREITPPTEPPTNTPTVAPTPVPPTASPTKLFTPSPTIAPTPLPTPLPSGSSTASPTPPPTHLPTPLPTVSPTTPPTRTPTAWPTPWPTNSPTMFPTETSTVSPTPQPSQSPTASPTGTPTTPWPANSTTVPPTETTVSPTPQPSDSPWPTNYPTVLPTETSTASPTPQPSHSPTVSPTGTPTTPWPTYSPTVPPIETTASPTPQASDSPTASPTDAPTTSPTPRPSSPTASFTGGPTPSLIPLPTNPNTDGGEPTTPSPADTPVSAPSSSPPTEGATGDSDGESTNNATNWEGGSGPTDWVPDKTTDEKGNQSTSNESDDDPVLIFSLIAAGAAVVMFAGLLVYRRRRQHLNETGTGEFLGVESDLDSIDPSVMTPLSKVLGVECDMDSSDPSSDPRVMTPSSKATNVDSVFCGLDSGSLGSPHLMKTNSLSSATTVRANNYRGLTPRSTTHGNESLFAFSEQESEDESVEICAINLFDSPAHSERYSPSNKRPVTIMMQEHLFSSEDGNRTATPITSPASYSKMMDTGDDDWKPKTNDSSGALIAAGVVGAAATAAAVAMARRRSNDSSNNSEADGSFPRANDSYPHVNDSDMDLSRRYHAGYQGEGDGTMVYQTAAAGHMPDTSDDDSAQSNQNSGLLCGSPALFHNDEKKRNQNTTPRSALSSLSGSVQTNASKDTESSQFSASRQLINDLVWLEKKIADVRSSALLATEVKSPDADGTVDSLSPLSNVPTNSSPYTDEAIRDEFVNTSIVYRDLQVPPGKLNVVIHSTKDGPAVYSVNEESALEGKLFPGDLIMAVDSVETRHLSAEEVMKMMVEKNDVERKITVLHFAGVDSG